MSLPSSHSLQTLSDSESIPISIGHQPLSGDTDYISWSEEDISNLVAALRGDESTPEVRAQLDALFNDSKESLLDAYEHALASPADAQVDGSNHDELPAPQQGTSTDVQYVDNAQASFPTLGNPTAPVAALPQIDGKLYYPPHPSADPQAPTQDDALPQHEYDAGHAMDGPPSDYHTQSSTAPQGPAWSQHEYNPGYYANGPPSAYYSQPSAAVQAAPQGYTWPQLGYHPAPSYPDQQPQTVAGPSNVNYPTGAFPQGQYAPLQMGFGGGSTVQPSSTASTRHRKRKSRQTVASRDGSSISLVQQRPQKRRRPNLDDNRTGKFGPYTLADASATVMPMPVHDPQPVDITTRRTHDPDGNLLRTRRFGVMELDDSCPDASEDVMVHHSLGLTCVRLCDWTDQPCGLFIEVDRVNIEDHLWHWHGVKKAIPTPCQFKDCTELEPMLYLGRHIEGVHFDTSSRCPYCKKLCARTDSLRRHQRGCKALSDSREHAMHGGYEFHLKEAIECVFGYIVPPKNAT